MKQLEFDEVTANILRSEFNTMRNYHENSIRVRGVATEASTAYAKTLGRKAWGILADKESGPISARWASKIMGYLDQHYWNVTDAIVNERGE